MKELVVISGKGGTGKTSIVACFAALAESKVLADCDVDAADLHLVLEPQVRHREDFRGGKQARVVVERCVACGKCEEVCRFGAISFDGPPADAVARTATHGRAQVHRYPCDHFDVWPGHDWFAHACADQVRFLTRTLKPTAKERVSVVGG